MGKDSGELENACESKQCEVKQDGEKERKGLCTKMERLSREGDRWGWMCKEDGDGNDDGKSRDSRREDRNHGR